MGVILDGVNFLDDHVERVCHELVHLLWLMTFHKMRLVTIAGGKLSQLGISQTAEYCWVCDFVAVQVQDRKNGAVANGIQELVRMPTGREWTCLGFTVTDHAANQQVWVVKGCSVCVSNRVSQFTAFMNRARRLRCDVAWNTSWERELLEELFQAFLGL